MTDTITPTETDEAVLTELLILFVNSEPVSKSLALIARHAQQAREEERELFRKIVSRYKRDENSDVADCCHETACGIDGEIATVRNTKGRDDAA